MSNNNHNPVGESQSSTSRKAGRKRSWWPTECFSLQPDNDGSSASDNLYTTCNGCGWQTKSATMNATQLGQHLLQCDFTSPTTLARLLKSPSMLRAYQKLGSSSEVYGIPLTPAKRRYDSLRTPVPPAPHQDLQARAPDTTCSDWMFSGTDQRKAFEAKLSRFNQLLTRFVVNHMLPFSILTRKEDENELCELIKLLDPRFEKHIPTIARMAGKNVKGYYETQLKFVKSAITSSLKQSYGTLIFDGWTDASSQNVTNVLLTITGMDRSRTSYFLRSIYTGSTSCDASLYANIVDSVFQDFGEITRVSGVVSDNTSSCVKAKEELAKRHNHIIPSQDQTHVANLLMQDIGELQWINEILGTVSRVVSDLRKHSKLYFRFKQLKEQYNNNLRNSGYVTTQRELDEYGRVLPIRTAVLPMHMATTRFASSEGMLYSFIRSQPVYRELVECPDFSKTLYGGRNAQKRDYFQATVLDSSLFTKCLDIYHPFRLMRHYLRIFDEDTSVISEVYLATKQLQSQLSALPLTPFFTAERKEQVMSTFRRRLQDESRKIPLLTSLHYVAYYLDIRSVNEEFTEHSAAILKHIRAFVASDVYPPTQRLASSGGVDGAVHRLFEEFSFIRLSWRAQADNPAQRDVLMAFKNIPVVYWIQYRDSPLLREFALRILSVSPSSSSVERSFSLQGRIRTPTRNRLHPVKVEKMIFCAFNRALTSRKRNLNNKRYRPTFGNTSGPQMPGAALDTAAQTHPELPGTNAGNDTATEPQVPSATAGNTDHFESYFNFDLQVEDLNTDGPASTEPTFAEWDDEEDDSEDLPNTAVMRRLFD